MGKRVIEGGGGGAEDAVAAVERYLRHVGRHDVEAATACLSDGFVVRFGDAGFEMGRDDALRALAWDAGAGGRIDWEVEEASRGRVTVRGEEANDFLDLLGIGALAFRSTYTVGPDGRLAAQDHRVTWGDVSLDEAMAPLVAWAESHEPDELAEILPGGRMVYTGAMAERWVALARRWRASEGGGSDHR